MIFLGLLTRHLPELTTLALLIAFRVVIILADKNSWLQAVLDECLRNETCQLPRLSACPEGSLNHARSPIQLRPTCVFVLTGLLITLQFPVCIHSIQAEVEVHYVTTVIKAHDDKMDPTMMSQPPKIWLVTGVFSKFSRTYTTRFSDQIRCFPRAWTRNSSCSPREKR